MLTGDARYGDWIEKLIYNGAGADIPLSPDGKVLYYSDYNPYEGKKRDYYKSWTCCNGTRPEDVAEYAHLIYFKNKNDIFINLYTPSHVEWNGITLTQETRFPESNEIIFKINTSKNSSAKPSLHFRKPGWLTSIPKLLVNGKQIDPVNLFERNNWIGLTNIWKDGDEIKLILPMELAVSHLDETKKYPAAITYGPVVMAVRSGKQYPSRLLERANPFSDFIPVAGEPLNWHVKNMPDLLIKPYYTYKEDEWYVLYLDPEVQNRISEQDIKIKGNWKRWRGSGYFFTNEKDASLTATFQGKGIRLYLIGFPNSGKCQVWIDGKLIDTIDEYRLQSHAAFQKEYKDLDEKKHTVSIKVLNKKDERATNTFINVNWFEVL
jgi:hypothetical protein